MSHASVLNRHVRPVDFPVASVRSQVVDVGQQGASLQHRLVHLVAWLDDSGEWVLDGMATCAHWVSAALDIEVSTAREWIRIGKKLRSLTLLDEHFENRQLSYSKVRLLTRLATADNERELCELALNTPAGMLSRVIAGWQISREEPSETERRHRQNRSLAWRVEPDGMVMGWFRLPAEQGAIVVEAVDAWVAKRRSRESLSPQHVPDASADAADVHVRPRWPSYPQQRADALVSLICGSGATVTTEVVIHVRGDGSTFDNGVPVAGSVVERMIPQSFIRALIHDAMSRPINASGRQRHPTTRQKRVVKERDRTCRDCGGGEFFEYDHVPEFAVSQHTVVDELVLRCQTCHRARSS